ncbi:alpha/beta hydrolase [Burkholderia multivorans]|uniref:alpha/beta hydrolase n=1 Tax=Burkholderia multivorans TaxID=87883 RepID=UPI000CFF0F49|nr:alpha/beta hydrolase [Burkholderia multivorans]MCL4626081.1 alpha/beta hydrolase [Burkholderia multivorans]PRG81460.1 acetylxylan esterase [Burkholderia multivorans]
MRTDISFRTSDGIELKGWLYRPEGVAGRTLPAIVMAHGFSGVKEQYLDKYAEVFCDAGFVVLVYDNRNFGESAGTPRQEIDPLLQVRDYRDGISYVSSLEFVDETRIGVWGSSYSGGHVLQVAAFDRRVKCVVSQVPAISGSNDLKTAVRPDLMGGLVQAFNADRDNRFRGESPGTLEVVSLDPDSGAALPGEDAYAYFVHSARDFAPNWKNEITLRSIEMLNEYEPGYAIDRISPTPLLMIVALFDTCAPADQALRAYERALHPKALVTIPCTHFQPYIEYFSQTSGDALNWFEKHLKTDAEQG